MRKRYRSLKSAFLGSILYLYIPFQVVVSIVDISISRYELLRANREQEQLTERAIVKALEFTHASLRMLELSLSEELLDVQRRLRDDYERLGSDPFKINLKSLKASYRGRYDFCLLDDSGNILRSTLGPAQVMELRSMPDLRDRLGEALSSELFLSEGLLPDIERGIVSMSAWMATLDRRAVFIVFRKTNEFSVQLSEFDFRATMKEFLTINPAIVSIRLYDRFGREIDAMGDLPRTGKRFRPVPSRFNPKTPTYDVQDPGRSRLVRFIYIDEAQPGAFDRSRILEITWSTEDITMKLATKAWLQVGLIALFTLVGVILLRIASSRISRPIHALVEAVREISSGNLDMEVEAKSPNELRLLERGINRMVHSLRKTIASLEESRSVIQRHSENLESIVRKRTEELEAANRNIAFAFDRTRKELRTARAVQNSILPLGGRTFDDVVFSAAFIPMDELGGDYFDVFRLGERSTAIVIADVVGHGVSAALVTMMAKIAFVNNVVPGRGAAEILTDVNAQLCKTIGDIDKYLTVFFGIIDAEAGTFDYVNAGHPSAYLLRKDGTADELPPHAPLVGAFETEVYDSCSGSLAPGDHILLYTDGVTEARSAAGAFFGVDRLLASARDSRDGTCEEICRAIVADSTRFRGAAPVEDDMTVIVTGIRERTRDSNEERSR